VQKEQHLASLLAGSSSQAGGTSQAPADDSMSFDGDGVDDANTNTGTVLMEDEDSQDSQVAYGTRSRSGSLEKGGRPKRSK